MMNAGNPMHKSTAEISRRVLARFLAAPLVLIGFACLAADDVSGNWDLKVETAQGTATPSMTLKQQDEKLTGTYRGRMGESALQGSIKDGKIRFSVALKFRDQEFTVTYSGTVEGNSMKGTVQFGDSGSGKWTATRK
jgi:hypothetical protein